MANIKIRTRSGPSTHLVRPHPQEGGKFGLWVSEHDKFSAYVHGDVLEFIKRNGDTAAPHETIGLLAGRICNDPVSGPYALVMVAENAVSGEFESSPGHVKLKAAGQTQLRRRLEMAHPDREIIGWYHTHPNYPPTFSQVDAQEQRTWSDQNSIGIVYSTLEDGAQAFGVYRGPNSDRLRPVSDITKKTVPAPQPSPHPQATLAYLTPRPGPLVEKETILTSTPAARSMMIQLLILSIFAIICLAQVFGLFRLGRRLSSAEERLNQLSSIPPAPERARDPAPAPVSSTSKSSQSSASQTDGPELHMPVKALTPAPARRQPSSPTAKRAETSPARRKPSPNKHDTTASTTKKVNADKTKQTSTAATTTKPEAVKAPTPKATPK